MPATPEEMKTLVSAFEAAHAPVARAMADLLLQGNVVLEEHGLLEDPIGDAFETFVLATLAEHDIQQEAFAATLIDLTRLRDTIDELDHLPP